MSEYVSSIEPEHQLPDFEWRAGPIQKTAGGPLPPFARACESCDAPSGDQRFCSDCTDALVRLHDAALPVQDPERGNPSE